MIFRCDATRQTGLGHLSRCLGLAEALRDLGCDSHFAGSYEGTGAASLEAAGFSCVRWTDVAGSLADAGALATRARNMRVPAIVADDYRIDDAWLQCLRDQGWLPIVFDDFGRLAAYAACTGIINFGVGHTRPPYGDLSAERILFGPQFFPARRELATVRDARSARSQPKDPGKILITLGGHDRHGLLWPLLSTLSRVVPPATLRAVVAPEVMESDLARPFQDCLVAATPFMAPHFLWADVCITGGGLTKYECAYVGLPAALMAQTVDEQSEATLFASEQLGFDLGGVTMLDCLEARLVDFIRQADRRQVLAQNGLDRFAAQGSLMAARRVLSWTT